MDLHERCAALRGQLERAESLLSSSFKGLFCHRYKDSDPAIRESMVRSLGEWAVAHPRLFLTGGSEGQRAAKTKYFGWVLYDTNQQVAALAALAALAHTAPRARGGRGRARSLRGRAARSGIDRPPPAPWVGLSFDPHLRPGMLPSHRAPPGSDDHPSDPATTAVPPPAPPRRRNLAGKSTWR